MENQNQNKKEFKNYSQEETKAWLKAMEHVYEPFFEPGDFTYDSKTGKKLVYQEDGTWKEEAAEK